MFNSEKMVIQPSRLYGFWIHFSRTKSSNYVPEFMPPNETIILHLARKVIF